MCVYQSLNGFPLLFFACFLGFLGVWAVNGQSYVSFFFTLFSLATAEIPRRCWLQGWGCTHSWFLALSSCLSLSCLVMIWSPFHSVYRFLDFFPAVEQWIPERKIGLGFCCINIYFFLFLTYLMMQRLTFPFPFVHHQTHDWLLSVLEWHLCSSQKERGLMMVQHFQDLQP